MDGHVALTSSLSVSLWRYSNARRIGADRDSKKRKFFLIELHEHKHPVAQQRSLPAQHLANPRVPISPQMAMSADDEARHCRVHIRPRTQQRIFDVEKISLTGNHRVSCQRWTRFSEPQGDIWMCSKVHRVLDQHERVKWGQNESVKR